MKKVLLLTKDTGYLAGSLKRSNLSMDIEEIQDLFSQQGFSVYISTFESLQDLSQYKGWYVLYASSEDQGLFYKSYIEDVALALQQAGAILLPRYELLRAHHNKSYMEMKRMTIEDERFKTIRSRAYSSSDSLINSGDIKRFSYPIVIKASAGAGSTTVKLVHTEKEACKAAKKLSHVFYTQHSWQSFCQCEVMHLARKAYRKIKHKKGRLPHPGEKIVVQNFIPGMGNDYKVLVFGKKYYILERKNRENDFRASGSGIFSFPQQPEQITPILDFARDFYRVIDSPLCSLDIGRTEDVCHLIEFQCVNFGPYTLEFSDCWYEKSESGEWEKHVGNSVLEQEYARAMIAYINNAGEQ